MDGGEDRRLLGAILGSVVVGSWVLLISAHIMSRARSEFDVFGGSLDICTQVDVVKAGNLRLL